MSTVTFHKLALHLEKIKTIYKTLEVPNREIKEIEMAIEIFHKFGDVSVNSLGLQPTVVKDTKKNAKLLFTDALNLLVQDRYEELVGTKMNYKDFHTPQQVVEYIEANPKTKVMKAATALDLKLMYCLLTGDKKEIKGTKNEVYESIKRNIRAKKRGKAFLEHV